MIWSGTSGRGQHIRILKAPIPRSFEARGRGASRTLGRFFDSLADAFAPKDKPETAPCGRDARTKMAKGRMKNERGQIVVRASRGVTATESASGHADLASTGVPGPHLCRNNLSAMRPAPHKCRPGSRGERDAVSSPGVEAGRRRTIGVVAALPIYPRATTPMVRRWVAGTPQRHSGPEGR
jgi:hypothetical protein